jgi:esterase/lipase
MRTQRRVFEKLSESTKVELASERIELSISGDIKKELSGSNGLIKKLEASEKKMRKQVKEYESSYDNNTSLLKDAASRARLIENVIDRVETMAKELGVKASSVDGFSDLLERKKLLDSKQSTNKFRSPYK